MNKKQIFRLVGLSLPKSITCETLSTEDHFWPKNNLTQVEFDSLWEYFHTQDNDFGDMRFVQVTCDGLHEDGTPINGSIESINDILL